jgi:outer membrane protein
MRNWLFLFLICFIAQLVSGQNVLQKEALIQDVLAQNLGIKLVRNDAKIADNENNIGNAGYLPKISVFAERDWTFNSARQQFLGGQTLEVDNARNLSLNSIAQLEWTIFDGFKMFATDKKLTELSKMAQLNLQAEVEMKVYETSMAFYNLLLLQRMEEIYEQSIDFTLDRIAYFQNLVNAGASSDIDLMQAELDLMNDSSMYLSNRQQLLQQKNVIRNLLAANSDYEFEISGEFPSTIASVTWEDLLSKAKRINTQLLLAKSNFAVAALEQKEVRSRYYPQIGLLANYNFNTAENEVGFLLSNRTYGPAVGIVFRWDILDHLSRYQEHKNSKIRLENAELLEKEVDLEMEKSLNDAYIAYNWAQKQLALAIRAERKTESIIDIAKASFESGALTPFELREVQFSIIQAQTNILNAKMDYVIAKMNMELVLGEYQNVL